MVKPLIGEQLLLKSIEEVGEVLRKEMIKIDFDDEKSKHAFRTGALLTVFILIFMMMIVFTFRR